MKPIKLIIYIMSVVLLFALTVGLFFILDQNSQEVASEKPEPIKRAIIIEDSKEPENASPLSGLPCDNYDRRPMAVILAEDPATRPLSGLSDADLVIEMSVITNEITRLMAVYVCGEPADIGSVRSARHDFIPLAQGLDAVLAHWGGSHFALDQLDLGVMDNLDAMANLFSAFYRKNGVPMPHDGFTDIERLRRSAGKIGYRLENTFKGYIHDFRRMDTSHLDANTLSINYPYPYNVEYRYKPETNSYLRFRAGTPEMDKTTNSQVEAKSIVIMKAASRQIEGPYYNDVDVEGEGDCQVYQNGEVLECSWQKDKADPASKLFFLDEEGEEIEFTPGQMWINIVEPDQIIKWQ